MLLAIAVYDTQASTPNKPFTLLKAGYRKGFFSNNQLNHLENIEKDILPQLTSQKMSTEISYGYSNREHYYLKAIAESALNMLIISRKKLDVIELHYLFINIAHIHAYQGKTTHTLDNIITNPMGYTGKDHKIADIKNMLNDTKEIMEENIKKVILRGEKIETLVQRSEQLEVDSFALAKRAKEMNSCCRIL